MSRNILACVLAATLSATLPSLSLADDAALYAEPAPADAAFVRFIGFAPGAKVDFAGLSFDIPQEAPNSYIAVSSARLTNIDSGAYLSILPAQDGTLRRVDEPARETRSKVHLLVINAGTDAVTLSTADGAMAVVQNVTPGAAASRAVNPVAVSLGVFSAPGAPLDTFDVALRRGQNLSFVVTESNVHLIENSFGPVLK